MHKLTNYSQSTPPLCTQHKRLHTYAAHTPMQSIPSHIPYRQPVKLFLAESYLFISNIWRRCLLKSFPSSTSSTINCSLLHPLSQSLKRATMSARHILHKYFDQFNPNAFNNRMSTTPRYILFNLSHQSRSIRSERRMTSILYTSLTNRPQFLFTPNFNTLTVSRLRIALSVLHTFCHSHPILHRDNLYAFVFIKRDSRAQIHTTIPRASS